LLAIKIDRENLLKTTIEEFSDKPLKKIFQTISVKFLNEDGVDDGKPKPLY